MSGLPKQCCASGSLHTGTPTGRVGKIHGLDCYIAEPPTGTTPKGVVVIIPDIFGWKLPNSRILADEYAKQGPFVVYLPDFMDDYMFPESLLVSVDAITAKGFVANLMKLYHFACLIYYLVPFRIVNNESKVRPLIWRFFINLRKDEGADLPVGAAGFCWGGKWTVELCADEHKMPDGKSIIDCGFTAHPSSLKIPGDIEAVVKPLSIAASEHDMQLSKAKADQTKDILAAKSAKGKDQGVEHEFVWYPGAWHGFAVRANEKDLEEAERGKKAERQAVDWFSRWFSVDSM